MIPDLRITGAPAGFTLPPPPCSLSGVPWM
jgi:hypothetical protein